MLLCSAKLYYKSLTDFLSIRYGDKSPKSVVARVFSIIWILLGLIIMAIFMANITSALTALSLQMEPSSLVGVKVGLILSQLVVSFQFYLSLCVVSPLSLANRKLSCTTFKIAHKMLDLSVNESNFSQDDRIHTFVLVFFLWLAASAFIL